MKNLFKYIILGVFIFSFGSVSLNAFAATDTSIPIKKTITLATVNIQRVKILSQEDNIFTISFNLTNREGLQTGVKYGVQLVSEGKIGKSIVDEKIYDESLTLHENSSLAKEITYTAPKELNGQYTLFITSNNSSGFPFSVAFAGKVNLTSEIKGFEIVTNSCYLKVEGEKSNAHYGLLQGVDISDDESLRLTCNTINHRNETLLLTPSVETRYRSSYGEIPSQTGGDMSAISFAASKSESFSLVLPKGSVPQLYAVKVSLSNEQTISNPVELHYFIRGTSATIENLSLDKDYYKMGETAHLSLLWTKFGTEFLRVKSNPSTPSAISLYTVITNSHDKECAEPISQIVTKNPEQPFTEISIPITSSCSNPHVALRLSDDAGNILDQKDFMFETKKLSEARPLASIYAWLIIILLIIVIIWMFMKKKNNKNTSGSSVTMNIILPFLIFTAIGSILPVHKVSADTYYAGANGSLESTVTIDNSTYAPGGTISVTSSITSYDTVPNTVKLEATTIGNAPVLLISTQVLNAGATTGYAYDAFVTPGAPSTPGPYLVNFSTGVEENSAPTCVANQSNISFVGPIAVRRGKINYTGPAIHMPITVRVNLYGLATPPGAQPDTITGTPTFIIPENSTHSFLQSSNLDCTAGGCELTPPSGFDHGVIQTLTCTDGE